MSFHLVEGYSSLKVWLCRMFTVEDGHVYDATAGFATVTSDYGYPLVLLPSPTLRTVVRLFGFVDHLSHNLDTMLHFPTWKRGRGWARGGSYRVIMSLFIYNGTGLGHRVTIDEPSNGRELELVRTIGCR